MFEDPYKDAQDNIFTTLRSVIQCGIICTGVIVALIIAGVIAL